MAEETITILSLNADDGVKTLKDLKNNISELKRQLDTLEVGSKDYANTLLELQDNQAALKNAMHATSEAVEDQDNSFAQTARAAQGLGTSYNSLVRQMAKLDEAFRSTEDAAERADLGEQIKIINDQLKDLDAERGKFGRNVGNYQSALSGLSDILKDMPPTLGKTATSIKNVGQSMALVGKQPVLGIIGLIAPIITNITSALKDNDTALGAVKKGMEALQPIFNAVQKILDKIAGWFAKIVDGLVEFAGQHKEAFKTFISGAVGVGNAVLQFILTPIRTTIEAVKGLGHVIKDVFTGQWGKIKEDAGTAINGIKDAFTKGIDFKSSFEQGKAVGEQFIAGLGSTKKKAKETGTAIAQEVLKGVDEVLKDIDKHMDVGIQARLDAEKQAAKEAAELTGAIEATNAGLTESIQAELDAQLQAEWEAKEEEKRMMKERMDTFTHFAGTVSSIFGAIADIYDANGEEDAKSAARSKALRTAAAIIDTLSGAVAAYRSTIESLPTPANMIAAPLNAAAVIAAGMANVRKINAVKVPGASGSTAVPALAAAPAVSPAISQVRTITGASEEDRLNQMASNQRVYIVYSDIEAAQRGQRVRVAEAAF